jgi:uncharacterized protein YbjT (DUF2867 family)
MANTNARRTILVTGATGRQGGAVARHLRQRGFPVRGLVRDTSAPAARKLMDQGVEIVRGDFDDRASLAKAMDGAYGVFSVQNRGDSGVDGEVRQGRAVADAAQRAGVRHLVYTSAAAADQRTGISFIESKGRIEEHIRNLGVPYTILRPVFFMENWLSMRGMIAAGEIALPLSPDRTLQQIAVDDIGGVAAAAFEHVGKWQGRAVELVGDEPAMQAMAGLFSRAAGREVHYKQIPWDRFEQSQGPEWTQFYRYMQDTGIRTDIAALRQEYPRLTTLAAWIEQQKWETAGGAPQRA